MLRKILSSSCVLLLTGAATLATPDSVRAHVGGGAPVAGAHVGIAHANLYRGVYRGGLYRGGYRHAYLPYHRYSSYYPYYPIYANYYPFYFGIYPYAWWSPTYNPGWDDPRVYGWPAYQFGSPSVAPPPDSDTAQPSSDKALSQSSTAQPKKDKGVAHPSAAESSRIAHFTVSLPRDARLWFDNKLTTATGSVRNFSSPPLPPDSRYSYDIQATWNDKGREVTQTQTVEVTPGAHIKVQFPVSPRTSKQASTDSPR